MASSSSIKIDVLHPRLNRYDCKTCNRSMITTEVVEGVTPFVLRCRATRKCGGFMESQCYRAAIDRPATHEWRRAGPLLLMYLRIRRWFGDYRAINMLNHYERGGLRLYRLPRCKSNI